MSYQWLVLMPPVIVLVLGFATRRVMFSLSCGILTASLIATKFSPLSALMLSFSSLWSNTQLGNLASISSFVSSDNLFIYIFLFILGIIVTLLGHSGGSYAYGKVVGERLGSAKAAEASSLLLSMLLFVDDYFNSLTVGSVMHPLTDRFKIPRVKLAFLVDSLAAPLAMVIPVSSWVAVIVGFIRENGVSLRSQAETTTIIANPFNVYLHIIPYVFYSLIIFISAWFIVLRRISFGSMKMHETVAQQTGNLYGGKQQTEGRMAQTSRNNNHDASLIDFIFPVSSLVVCIVSGLLFTGRFYLFGGKNGFIEALQNADASLTLFLGGVCMLTICTLFFIVRKRLVLNEVFPVYKRGIKLMLPSIVILLLSWTFGNILNEELHTGQYLANVLIGSVPIPMLPIMFFIASSITSFSIGSSWGTMGIMFPIAISMVLSFLGLEIPTTLAQAPILLPVLGGILSGGVLGDHISPISDTTVMSSTSTGSHHIDHVQTQMVYAVPIAFGTGIAFLVAGLITTKLSIATAFVAGGIGTLISITLLQLLSFMANRKA